MNFTYTRLSTNHLALIFRILLMQPTHGADIPHVFPNNQNKNDNYGTNHTNLPPVNAPLSQHPLNVGQRQGVLEPQSQGHPNPQYQYGPSQQQTPSAVASGNKSIQNINLGYIDPRQNITPTMNLTNSHISPHASSMTAGSSFIPEKQFSQYKPATFETHKLNAQQSQNVHPQLMATIHQTGLPSAGSPTNAANLPTQYTAQRPVSMTSNSQNNHIQLNQRTKEASQYTGSVLNSTQHVPTTNLQTISQNTQPPISRNNSVNSNNSLSTSNVYSGPIPSAKNDYKNSHISAAPNSFPPHQYVTGNFPQNTSSNPNPYLYQSTSSTLPNSENSNLTTPPHLPHSSQSIPLAQSSQMGPNFPSNYTPNSNHSSVINPSLPSKLSVDVNLSRNTHPTAIQSVELLGEPRTNYPSDQHTSHPANTIPAVASGSIRPQGFIQGISKSKHPNDKIDVLSENMQHLKMDTQLPVPILGTPQPLDDLDRAPLANMQTVPSLDPSFVRTSFTSFPRSSTCLNKTKIPFGITFTPYPSFSTSPEGKPVSYDYQFFKPTAFIYILQI